MKRRVEQARRKLRSDKISSFEKEKIGSKWKQVEDICSTGGGQWQKFSEEDSLNIPFYS